MTPIPEVFYPRKSSPPDPTRPLPRWLRPLAFLAILGLLSIGAVQFVLGFVGEYHGALAAKAAAEKRAELAEGQLAEMLKHGDQGVLIANVSKDLIGWQVRLVPATNNYRGRN